MEPFVGQIIIVGFDYAPIDFAQCNGQTLPISSYSLLYAVLGTTYGGNGTTNLGLPDLRGRVPMGAGNGAGLSNRNMGQEGGLENITLSVNNLPAHTHSLSGVTLTPGASGKGVTVANTPNGNYLGNSQSVDLYSNTAASGSIAGLSGNTDSTGLGQAISNVQPFTVVNFLIATNGIYPSRP
jgi:microcystin-dependent protein